MGNKPKAYYNCAYKQGKDWWCRRKDQKSSGEQIIAWRIGWSRAVREALGNRKEELQGFLKRIDGGRAWESGRKKGTQDASLTIEEYETKVTDFRHAAWLLGWLEGYSEKGTDVDEHTGGSGSKYGRTAGRFYMCLLAEEGWMENSKVKKLLGIDSEE